MPTQNLNLSAQVTTTSLSQTITALFSSAGTAINYTQPTSGVAIGNIGAGTAQYRIDNSDWIVLDKGESNYLPVDLSVNRVLVKLINDGATTTQLDILTESLPNFYIGPSGEQFPVANPPVRISGYRYSGAVATAVAGAGYSFTAGQWYRNGVAISGQTAVTYTRTDTDIGTEITFTPTGVPFTASGGTTLITLSTTLPAPQFTVPPTLSPSLPVVGSAVNAIAGTVTGTVTSETLTVMKLTNDGWINVGQGYVLDARDLQLRFIASHSVSNSGGADIATGGIVGQGSRPGVQTVGLQPAFNQSTDPANATTNVTGEPVNPYFMADQVPVGFRVKLWLGKTTAGAIVTPTYLVETGVGTGVYAAGAGTSGVTSGTNISVYSWYQPATGEVGRRLVADCVLTGTGSNPQPTFRTDPVMIVAATAATGKVRAVAVHNRMPLQPSNTGIVDNTVVRRVLSNMKRVMGSGPVTSIIPIASNVTDLGPTGSAMRITGADCVYNGVVVPCRVAGVAATEGAPLLVPNGGKLVFDEILATAFGALNHIPAGEGPLFRMKTEVPVGTIIGCVETTDLIAEHIWIEPGDTITNDIGNTNSGNQYLLSATVANPGPNAGQKVQGPVLQIMGKFACGEPKVIVSTRDSKGALGGGGSFHFGLTTFIPGKAPLAGLLIARSGTNTGMITSSAELQSYFAYGWIYINGYGVNAIGDTANVGNARGLDTASADIWALMKANAATGAGVHAPVVIQTGIDYHFRANNANPTTTFVTTISSRQTPYIPFDVGGDITVHFTNAMKAAVTAGTIAAFVDHRDVYSLSSDPASPLYLKVKQGWFSDQLHPGDAIPGGRIGRKVVDAIV